jgi:uncharacterized protein
MQPQLSPPLTDDEVERLARFLDAHEGAMGIERLDGFLCSLVVGPELITLDEYWPIALSRDPADMDVFADSAEADEILGLVMKHWSSIATRINIGRIYLPVIPDARQARLAGREWALGFMAAVNMRKESWSQLFADEEASAALFPMLVFLQEIDADGSMRLDALTADRRNELIAMMVEGFVAIHRYFRARRAPPAARSSQMRSPGRQGRNDPCVCGSGLKFKHCCLRRAN